MRRIQDNAPNTISPACRVTIVRSAMYGELTTPLVEGAVDILRSAGLPDDHMQTITVPGAFEIPLACREVLESGNADGIIAIGVVVQGETCHASEITRACTDGLMHIMLTYGIPIAHCVVSAKSYAQAEQRAKCEGNRGEEAAHALVAVLRRANSHATDRAGSMGKALGRG